MFGTITLTGEAIVTHFRNSGCPCCLPRQESRQGLSRRQFLCTTAAGAAAAPAIAASVIGSASEAQAQARPAPGRPILIKGGIVLSLDRAVGDFEQADVLIEGKKISAVRPNISAPNAQVIDAKNRIVMPGFVDTHRHMWQGFLRNVLPDGSLDDYRNVVQRTFGAKMIPDDVYAANLLSALGAVDSGVTCALDWSHIQNSPEHSDACIKGLQESGVRAAFAYGSGQNETGRVSEGSQPPNIPATSRGCASSISPAMTNSPRFISQPAGRPKQRWRSSRPPVTSAPASPSMSASASSAGAHSWRR